MAACISVEMEEAMKPLDICELIKAELSLGECEGMKPKAVIEMAQQKLGLEPSTEKTAKEESQRCRAAIRLLPPRFWNPDISVSRGSSPSSLISWLLAKPASAGGFAAAVACVCISNKAIDTKSVTSGGSGMIDGFSILRASGSYNTIDHEMDCIARLFRSERNAEKIGDCTFIVQDRLQPAPGQMLMLAKSNKCNAKFAALLTPKWMLLGLYNFCATTESDTLALLEELRKEAFSTAAPQSAAVPEASESSAPPSSASE